MKRYILNSSNILCSKYGVFKLGGSIGQIDSYRKDGYKEKKFGNSSGFLIQTYDNFEEANEFAKRRRRELSPRAKNYYFEDYRVINLELEEELAAAVEEIRKSNPEWFDADYTDPYVEEGHEKEVRKLMKDKIQYSSLNSHDQKFVREYLDKIA